MRIERIQYPKSNCKRCREELVFEYPNCVVSPFSQHVSGRNTPIGAGEREHDREGKDARRQWGPAPPHATRRSEFPSEDLTIFMDCWVFTGCLGVRRQGASAAVRHPKFRIPAGGLKLRFFKSRSDQRIQSTYLNALIRRAGCSRRIFWVFCTVFAPFWARKNEEKKMQKQKFRKKIGGFVWGFIHVYPGVYLSSDHAIPGSGSNWN